MICKRTNFPAPTRFGTYILILKNQKVKDTVGKMYHSNKQKFYFELEIEGLHQDSINRREK
jgi:hypothetical protein